jgi:hypothetical protein
LGCWLLNTIGLGRRRFQVMASDSRSFPFVPRSSRDLFAGDYWAVPLANHRFGCAVVTDLLTSGAGSRVALIAGLLDWMGDAPPTPLHVEKSAIFAQGLTRIEAITKTGSQIIGNAVLPSTLVIAPNFRDHRVGTVHSVWGWRVLPKLIEGHFETR